MLTVAGKVGDALGPVMVVDQPLALLMLNANDVHLGLSVTVTSFFPWFLIGTLRRLAEDPVFFLIGWHYGEAARAWLRHRSAISAKALDFATERFTHFSVWAVLIEPGMVVCLLAGIARMSPLLFALANVGGTVVRLALIRGLAAQFPELLASILDGVRHFSSPLLLFACVATALGCWPLLRGGGATVAAEEHED